MLFLNENYLITNTGWIFLRLPILTIMKDRLHLFKKIEDKITLEHKI